MQAPKSHASGRSLSSHHNKENPTDGAEEDTLYPFYFGKDAGKQQGKLNRTLQSLNPFKVCPLLLIVGMWVVGCTQRETTFDLPVIAEKQSWWGVV